MRIYIGTDTMNSLHQKSLNEKNDYRTFHFRMIY